MTKYRCRHSHNKLEFLVIFYQNDEGMVGL
jgi:hypothetical protein